MRVGQDSTPPPLDLGYFTGHLQAYLRKGQEDAAVVRDLISRLGTRVSSQLAATVNAVATELVRENAHIAGTLRPSEILELEQCDTHTTIATADLSSEIFALMHQDSKRTTAAPGMFAHVVVENICSGYRYEYLVPQARNLYQESALLRQGIIGLSKLTPNTVDERLEILHVPVACVPGFVLHHILHDKLRQSSPQLWEQVERFIHPDPENRMKGYIATATPASPSYQQFSLIEKADIPHMLQEIDRLRLSAQRLRNA